MKISISRKLVGAVLWLLPFLAALAAILLGCGNPISGGNEPPHKPYHFDLTIENQDPGAPIETAVVCWWSGSTYVGSTTVPIPTGRSVTIGMGTNKPDGIQVVMTAWGGIPEGPGGDVLQGPSDYPVSWTPRLLYPSRTVLPR